MVDPLDLRAEFVIYPTLQEIESSMKLLKQGKLSRKEKLQLSRKIGEVIRELGREIITSRHEPMTASEVAEELLNIRNDILSSTGYLYAINMVIGDETTPQQFVGDLLSVRRYNLEKIEKTVSRLLSQDRIVFETDGLFWSRNWPPEEVVEICAQLVSKYRLKNDKMKELYKNAAIAFLESGMVDLPDKDGLIQTIRRL